MFGGGGSRDEVQPQQVQQAPLMPVEQSSQQGGACAFEIKQFFLIKSLGITVFI